LKHLKYKANRSINVLDCYLYKRIEIYKYVQSII